MDCPYNDMRKLYLIPFLVFAIKLQAQPSEVGGFLYQEDTRTGAGYGEVLYHLRHDGTFRVISGDPLSFGQQNGFHYPSSDPATSGEYEYAVTKPAPWAEGALKLGNKQRHLRFNQNGIAGSWATGGGFEFFAPAPANPRQNVSIRAFVQPGTVAICGFVLTEPQWILVRVLGPSLARFEVPSVAAKPKMAIYRGSERLFERSGWVYTNELATPESIAAGVEAMEHAFQVAGAFPLPRGSADCAVLRRFEAGIYSVHASNESGQPQAEVLLELYYLPFEIRRP